MALRFDIKEFEEDLYAAIDAPAFQEIQVLVVFSNNYFIFHSLEGHKDEFKVKEVRNKQSLKKTSIEDIKDEVFTAEDLKEFVGGEDTVEYDVFVSFKYGSGRFMSTEVALHA